MKLCSASSMLPILFCAAIATAVACRPAQAPASGSEGDGEAPASEADGGTGPEASADEAHPAPAGATEGSSANGGDAGAGPSPLAQVLVTDASEVQKIFEAAKAAPKATTKANGLAGAGALARGYESSPRRPHPA